MQYISLNQTISTFVEINYLPQLTHLQRVALDHFPINADAFEGHLGVFGGGIKFHQAEGASLVVSPDQTRRIDHFVGMAIGQT